MHITLSRKIVRLEHYLKGNKLIEVVKTAERIEQQVKLLLRQYEHNGSLFPLLEKMHAASVELISTIKSDSSTFESRANLFRSIRSNHVALLDELKKESRDLK